MIRSVQNVELVNVWVAEWGGAIVTEHETFKGVYKDLVIPIGNVLQHGHERRSWLKRLREWWRGR